MARKRAASELEAVPPRPRRDESKRSKLSPSEDTRSDSSVPSSCSVSEDSALQSSPSGSEHARQSSMSSMQSIGEDDSESSLSSSSEEPSADESLDDGEDVIPTIGGPKKPTMTTPHKGTKDLQERLAALLPQMKRANEELAEDGGKKWSIEDVEDGEQHIEMDLGLGVLEEKHGDDGSDESSSGEGDESEQNDDDDGSAVLRGDPCKQTKGERDSHVMDKLTGRAQERKKAVIEDLG